MSTVWDIETGPRDRKELEKIMPPFNSEDVKLGNIKDPEIIRKKIEEAKTRYEDNFFADAALSPLTGEVLAIGIWAKGADLPGVFDREHNSEAELLNKFWGMFQSIMTGINQRSILAGCNIFDFDLPFLVKRSWALGVQVPANTYTSRGGRVYWNDLFVDLRKEFLLGQDARQHISNLGAMAQFVGSKVKKSDNSAQFYLLWHDLTTREKAREHLRDDLRMTRDVLNAIRPEFA